MVHQDIDFTAVLTQTLINRGEVSTGLPSPFSSPVFKGITLNVKNSQVNNDIECTNREYKMNENK